MKVICMTCKRDLREKEPMADSSVSHGLCDDCFKVQMAEIEAYFTLNPPEQEARCGNAGQDIHLWGFPGGAA